MDRQLDMCPDKKMFVFVFICFFCFVFVNSKIQKFNNSEFGNSENLDLEISELSNSKLSNF